MTSKKNLAFIAVLCILCLACESKKEADFPATEVDLSIIPVQDSSGYFQYIDISQNGKVIINPQFNVAYFFIDGLALVETEHIMQANSIVDVINSLASMAGPVVGGLLFSIYGLTPILYVAVFCFLASAVMEIFIRIPHAKREAKGNMFATGFGDLKESFGFMFRENPVMWKVTFIYASTNLLLIPLIYIGVPILITQRLGFEASTANRLYGYAQGVIAAGAVLGGLLAGVFSKKLTLKLSPLVLIGCALSILSVGVALHTLKGSLEIYIILVIGCGLLLILSTLYQIQMMTCFQILTPKELIGKVVSVVMCVCYCAIPFGQFIYGIVFEYMESNAYVPFYAAALIMIGVSIFTRRIFYGVDDLMKKSN